MYLDVQRKRTRNFQMCIVANKISPYKKLKSTRNKEQHTCNDEYTKR